MIKQLKFSHLKIKLVTIEVNSEFKRGVKVMVYRILSIFSLSFGLVWGSLTIVDAYSDPLNVLTDVNDTGWQFGAEINENLLMERNQDQADFETALASKMNLDLNQSDVTGSMAITLTELRHMEDTKAIEGDGEAAFEFGDYTFTIPFEEQEIYQIEHNGSSIRALSLDEEYETANGEPDMININAYWKPSTDDVYVVGSVGFVTNLAEIVFGQKFITPEEFNQSQLVEIEDNNN